MDYLPRDPYGVYSEKKRVEKLDYMHNNPGRRKLVASPDVRPWSRRMV
jgi:hypothetical protein